MKTNISTIIKWKSLYNVGLVTTVYFYNRIGCRDDVLYFTIADLFCLCNSKPPSPHESFRYFFGLLIEFDSIITFQIS